MDPVWTDQDRELALAWVARDHRNCQGCGTRPEDWAEDRNALTWSRRYCPGCQVLEQGREQVPEHAREYVHVGLIPTALALLEEEVTGSDSASEAGSLGD